MSGLKYIGGVEMAKYRKKPIIINAFQWHNGDIFDGIKLVGGRAAIETLEGLLFLTNGDYIITGIKGEIYPCKPDIFEATYDLI